MALPALGFSKPHEMRQLQRQKTTLDPRLKMSRMTEGEDEMCQRMSEHIQE